MAYRIEADSVSESIWPSMALMLICCGKLSEVLILCVRGGCLARRPRCRHHCLFTHMAGRLLLSSSALPCYSDQAQVGKHCGSRGGGSSLPSPPPLISTKCLCPGSALGWHEASACFMKTLSLFCCTSILYPDRCLSFYTMPPTGIRSCLTGDLLQGREHATRPDSCLSSCFIFLMSA